MNLNMLTILTEIHLRCLPGSKMCRGVARKFLGGASKSSIMSSKT